MDINDNPNIGWYWMRTPSGVWLRCRLIAKTLSLHTLEALYGMDGIGVGDRKTGKVRRVGEAFILDVQ